MKITRRKLIFGTLGTAALVPASYALKVSLGGYTFSKAFDFLTAKEAVIVRAIAETVVPNTNELKITHDDADTVGTVNELLRYSSTLERTEIGILLWAVEHVFPVLGLHFKKFTQLSINEREAIIKKLDRSGQEIPKLLVRAIKTLGCFGYFSSPKVQEYYGLKGWCGP